MNIHHANFLAFTILILLSHQIYSQIPKFSKNLTKKKEWKLYQTREDEKINSKISESILFIFNSDGKGIREEAYKLGSKKVNVIQTYSFELSQDPANEYIIKFKNVAITKGKLNEIVTAPSFSNHTTYFVQLLGKDSTAIMRLSTPLTGVSKSTIHYYFK